MEPCERKFLEMQASSGKTYMHHPQWFMFEDGQKYMPDFYCKEDREYIEVAGTRQAFHANKHKYELMKKEFPLATLRIVHLWKKAPSMNKAQVAKQLNTSKTLVGYLIKNKRKTTNIPLAIAVAKFTGRKPVEFLSDKVKELALQIYPNLNRKPTR